jgi:multidrug resistance efflux pump
MMMNEQLYLAEQEYKRYQQLMAQEVLTQEEYDFCKAWDSESVVDMFYDSWNSTYLNLNVYSEHDHDKRQFEMETW